MILMFIFAAATIDAHVWREAPAVYVDFAWEGKERGTEDRPFSTLDKGLEAAGERGLLRVKGVSGWVGVIEHAVVIEGEARIGGTG